MTASSVKDPASLAYRIMVDTKSELQAVEKLQQMSIQQNRQETQRLRQEFVARQPDNSPSPTEPKSPRPIIKEVHFKDQPVSSKPPIIAPKPSLAGPKPSIAPKPTPRTEISSPLTSTAPVKGVRFNVPIAIEADEPIIETVRPPPGYENENEAVEETDSASPSPGTPRGAGLPRAPPPYEVAVNHRAAIKHVRQSEIQEAESLSDYLPNAPLNRKHLSDSREQLVDGSDKEDINYYENAGFEVSDGEPEQPVATSTYSVSRYNPPNGHVQSNDASQHMIPKIKPAIKPYSKAETMHSGQPYHTTTREADGGGQPNNNYTDISQLDYVNVYEDEHKSNERYVADIHNHFVEDLYPETSGQSHQSRGGAQNSSPSNIWAYNSNSSLPFYMTEGMKASEC